MSQLPRLAFSDKLSSAGGTDVLLKKLKNLHAELAAFEQGAVDVSSLDPVRKQLIATPMLLHRDRGVKAYVACCLADILRLYAPDAPYTQSDLRDIFQFFFRQLISGLKGPDAPYFTEYFHLLESLATVKSVVLICDLPSADQLLVDVFRDFFGLIRRDLPTKIELFMADILTALIDEAQTIPAEVLETILAQFMDKDIRIEQPAFRLAVQVCNATADKLQRHVCQYFTDVIVSHAKDEDFEDIRKAHSLVKRLQKSCPALLDNVIPQLEEELRVEEVQLRLIAVGTLGSMYGDKGGPELVRKHPSTWNLWLGRKNDKASAVRLRMVECAKGLILSLPEQRQPIEESLAAKLLDPDDKVRAAVCKVYSQLDYETALHHVSAQQLKAIGERGADKKNVVRVESLNCLGKLYGLAYPEIENNDPAAIAQFAWIPQEILRLVALSLDVRIVVEQVIADHILPLSTPAPAASSSKTSDIDEVAWTDRLLSVSSRLDDGATKALLNLTGLKNIRPHLCDHYLDACIKFNGGVIDENEEAITKKLKAVVQHLSHSFPDAHKASEDLHAFAKLNEQRLYKLLKTCMDAQTDLKMLIKATNEFTRRIEQSSSGISSTMTTLLRRASLRIVNTSSIPTLMKRAQRSNPEAQKLLTFISKHQPALWQSHLGELSKAIADDKNPGLVEIAVQALSAVARWDSKQAVSEKKNLERIHRLALESNHRHAKFAARFLAFSKNKEEACTELIQTIADNLTTAEPDVLTAHIAVLVQLARFVPDIFGLQSDVVISFLIKKVLMVPVVFENAMDVDDISAWLEEDDLDARTRAKILAIKVCRYRSLTQATSANAAEITKPVLNLLGTMLENFGSLKPNQPDDQRVASRLRLQAASSCLHLATVDTFRAAMAPRFVRLAIVVQDPCWVVRQRFLAKLISLLTARKLAAQYNVIPFLTVHDPEAEIKLTASSYISQSFRSLPAALKVESFEMIFIRLLHTIAHHPDFDKDPESLVDMAQYIDFYLDHIINADTAPLLLHLALKCKTVRDAFAEDSTNLYITAEIAQVLIKNRAKAKEWALPSYPGKIKLPSDILKPQPDAATANQVLKTVFLPENVAESLSSSKPKERPKEKKERKRKVPATGPKTNGAAKRAKITRRRKRKDSESEDEGSDSDSEASDHMSTDAPPPDVTEEEVDEESEGEEMLGRGARTRAKQKRLRQERAKQREKKKQSSPAPSALTELSSE